jgi:hypothetical protein
MAGQSNRFSDVGSSTVVQESISSIFMLIPVIRPLDINGENSKWRAITQKPVPFFKGSECRLGMLAALINPLQFDHLSA